MVKKILIAGGLILTLACATGSVVLLNSIWNVATPSPAKLELFKFILQLGLIVVLGSTTTLLIAEFNRQRDKRNRDIEYLRQKTDAINELRGDTLRDLVNAYSATKRARRLLKSRRSITNLDEKTKHVIPGIIDDDSIKIFDSLMESVIDAQLDLERITQSIQTCRHAFSNPEALKEAVVSMEQYLKEIVHEYQRLAAKLHNVEPSIKKVDISVLSDFIGSYEKSEFRTRFKRKYDEALQYVRQDMFSPPLSSFRDTKIR